MTVSNEGLNITAKAHVKLTKLDEHGNVVDTTEHDVNISREEAEALWRSRQPE